MLSAMDLARGRLDLPEKIFTVIIWVLKETALVTKYCARI